MFDEFVMNIQDGLDATDRAYLYTARIVARKGARRMDVVEVVKGLMENVEVVVGRREARGVVLPLVVVGSFCDGEEERVRCLSWVGGGTGGGVLRRVVDIWRDVWSEMEQCEEEVRWWGRGNGGEAGLLGGY